MSVSRAHFLGQLLFIRLDHSRWTPECERVIRLYRPGGVFFSARNLRTPGLTAQMLSKITSTSDIPPFLALEEEGGAAHPLRAFLPPLLSPRAAARNGPSTVERLGELAGEGLKLVGFNTNFAPTLDLSNPLSKPALDTQTFGPDPPAVARCGQAFAVGLRRHKVFACGKHFPGAGAAEIGAHRNLPLVDKTMAELWHEDLVPFRRLLPQLRLLRVSHAAYKAYDFDVALPAALSSNVLNGLLRVKLGYRGVAVANLLEAIEESNGAVAGDEFVNSFNAGCDVQMVGWGDKTIARILEELGKALDSGTLSMRRVEQALKRIGLAKRGIRLPSGRISKHALDQLARQIERFSRYYHSREQEIA